MRNLRYQLCFAILFIGLLNNSFSQTAFTAGDIVVMQIGDGGINPLTSKAYAQYVVELNPNGSVVQNVIIPNSTAGSRSVESGSASSDGDLNTSGDGKSITFGGYDAATSTANVASAANINRIICQINNAGTISFPSSYSGNNSGGTALYVTNNFRSVVTNDGTGFWSSGTGTRGGVNYIPSGTTNATTATAGVVRLNTTLANSRIVKIFNNQLYGNANSGTFVDPFTIGSGLPTTTGQTYTVLPGLTTLDSYSFVMFDRDNNGVLDLVYLADIGTTLGSGGLRKYYLNGATWTAAGLLTGNITGVAGYLDCTGNPIVYVSTIDPGNTGSPNEVYSYNDVTTNSTTISGSISTPTCSLILPTQAGYVYRGIAMAPNNGNFSWSAGSTNLSGAYRSIIISGGTVTLTGNISATDSIYVGSGATLICGTKLIKGKKFVLASGATIKIGSTTGITLSSPSGNVQTSCRTYSSGANYEYNGAAAQATGNGLPSIVNDLTTNNSSATGVTLTSAVTVSNVAYFTQGLITSTSTNLLSIASTGSVSGVSNSSFVKGPVRKIGNSAFVFPTGKGSYYAPVSISAPSLASDHFTAEYFNSNPNPTYSNALKDPTIDHISSCEYWMLDRTNGTSNVSVSLNYDSIRSCGVTNLTDLLVAHWDLSLATPIWKDMGVGSAFGTTASGTVSTTSLVTSFSPFTLASISTFNPLPIELLNFTAAYNDKNTVDLKWQTATEINNDFYSVERSADAVNFETIAIVDGAGNSTHVLSYATTDNSPLNGVSYYRLKQTDFDGKYEYSQTISVDHHLGVGNIFPNPATDKLTIEFDDQAMEQLDIKIFNSLGQQMYFNKKNENTSLNIDLSSFSNGVYLLIIDDGEKKVRQKFIKH